MFSIIIKTNFQQNFLSKLQYNLTTKNRTNFIINQTNRSLSGSIEPLNFNPKICIVGSGPAALYTAQYALKNIHPDSKPIIDIFEMLPVPFGLVRYGVAPDHQDVKNVINSFEATLKNPNVNFFGNVSIGKDLQINDLLNAYNSVVLAYGSHSENYLNIPGEKDFKNLVSAKDLVSLYNGLPQHKNLKIDFSGKHAVIIGAGNVAIDIARILLSPIEKLAQTDISENVLELLKNRNIEEVTILARRGILNAAFTLKELRELTKIDTIQCKIDLKQFQDIKIEKILSNLARPRKRITEYMHNLAKQSHEQTEKKKKINFVFLKTPVEIVGNSSTKKAEGVRIKTNKYDFDFLADQLKLDTEEALNSLKIIEETNKQIETIPADLIIRSIGFKNVNIDPDIPFDKKIGVIINERGKVIGKDGLYCTGWIKRGPRGVIVDTATDAYETAQQLCSELTLKPVIEKSGTQNIVNLLNERNVKFVDKEGWSRIDKEERNKGKLVGKPREKLNSVKEMLEVAFKK